MSAPTAEEMRASLRRLPTGVVTVTTSVDGVDFAMTANSFTSVCLDPPMVLVCVQRDTQFHEAVGRTGHWAVSVLAADQRDVAERLAHRGRPPETQLEGVEVWRSPGGLALVAGALAWVECHTLSAAPGGDHTVLIGSVAATGLMDRSPRRTPGPAGDDSADPLVYWERGFYGLLGNG